MVAACRFEDRSWWASWVDPDVLGDASRERDAVRRDWSRRRVPIDYADVRPPLLVLRDPRGRFGPGCSTNSHHDDHDRAHTDPHADCAHGRTLEMILGALHRG